MIETAMLYTNIALWTLGAITALFVFLNGVLYFAWMFYKELVGWPTIAKAMKAYRSELESTTKTPTQRRPKK